jgi:hypothetical protein
MNYKEIAAKNLAQKRHEEVVKSLREAFEVLKIVNPTQKDSRDKVRID